MGFFRRYRVLVILYGFGLVAAAWEITSPDPKQDRVPVNYPETMVELFPEGSEQLFFRGMQAMYGRGDLVEARRLFEEAFADGNKTNERLLHVYAVDLVMLEVGSDEIDQAIANWRRNFPRSALPDPRTFHGSQIGDGPPQEISRPGNR